jgi:protein-disulfide isomerase
MTETPGTGPQSASGSSNIAIYALCLIAGAAVGVLGTLLISGGVGGGSMGGDPVVAEFNGKSIRASEALGQVKGRVFELEEDIYRTKEQAINEFVEAKLLEAEAKKQNMPVEALVEKEAGGPPEEVNDKDVEDFLTSKGLSLNDPRIRTADVKDYLKYRKKFEKREGYVAKLKAASKVKILLPEPTAPKVTVATEGQPTWGNAKAPVTIVEFSDYQCPYCSRAEETVKKIKKEYGPDKVRVVYMDMPLPAHPRAYPASLAARCAEEQGKFWEFHDLLFTNQGKLEDGDFKEHAKTVGLDAAKFTDCYDKKKYADSIEASKKEAAKAGIQATPSFLINGQMLQGAQPFEKFKEKIDRALK